MTLMILLYQMKNFHSENEAYFHNLLAGINNIWKCLKLFDLLLPQFFVIFCKPNGLSEILAYFAPHLGDSMAYYSDSLRHFVPKSDVKKRTVQYFSLVTMNI